jgi:hypothetical protein
MYQIIHSIGLIKLNVPWLEKRKKQIPFPSTFVNVGDRFFKKRIMQFGTTFSNLAMDKVFGVISLLNK